MDVILPFVFLVDHLSTGDAHMLYRGDVLVHEVCNIDILNMNGQNIMSW